MSLTPWDELEKNFEILVLGNGASAAVDEGFLYQSLRQEAEGTGRITPNVSEIFNYLETSDFELVLKMLLHTSRVNQALRIDNDTPEAVYSEIKKALIETVRETHVPYEKVLRLLKPMWKFMENFHTVVSLNYDLLVYWAIMAGNEEIGGNHFKDCFVDENNQFRYNKWDELRQGWNGLKKSTLVFYPHGNLCLETDDTNSDRKIQRQEDNNLLNVILKRWEDDNISPLFVSEGTTQQKTKAISRSPYLSTVSKIVLPSLTGNVLVYGWSMSESDVHLVQRLITVNTPKVAISVHKGNKTYTEVEQKCHDFERLVQLCSPFTDVEFFDSQDQGCWLQTPS
ncbi:MAG: DUF4917 family protein [Desulfomonilaceae bacterium]